ncbi:MAG: hypothetical protein ACM3S1_07445 [Hyphomicrobiales bacterium]
MHIDEARVAAAKAQGVSAFQLGLIEDGTLTFAEYEQAILAMVQCSVDAGAGVAYMKAGHPILNEIRMTKQGLYDYAFRIPAEADESAITSAINGCKHEYSEMVEGFWSEHVRPSVEELNAAREALIDCMQDAGMDVPDGVSGEEFFQYTQPNGQPDPRYIDCVAKVDEEADLPYFGG